MRTNGTTITGHRSAEDALRHGGAALLVDRFLTLLAEGDVDQAVDLLAEDVDYTNVSLPTIRGRETVRRVLRSTLGRRAASFEVYTHHMGAAGDVVLTERTDVLSYGPVRVQFWVYGRFEVRRGQIAVWRDSFDWLAVTGATIRGLLGAVLPPLRARPPKD
ncbi:MAG: limonene,2-epoxide hydrolase [Solirubrobacterales bacterium]|nr:limonene,2-epoxide hydrolase [Solirubrobacterales bacterium]